MRFQNKILLETSKTAMIKGSIDLDDIQLLICMHTVTIKKRKTDNPTIIFGN